MRAKASIYVEGNDTIFVDQYIPYLDLSDKSLYRVIATKGKDKIYNNEFLIDLDKTTSSGGVNLIIFDANGENIETRKGKIIGKITEEAKKKNYNIKIDDIFLFPNDLENGAFENLLLNIVNPKHSKEIFECFDTYIGCIKKKGYSPIREKEINKSRVYCYLESLDKESKEIAKDKNRDYTNSDHWDLKNEYLIPLKEFLQTHLK